MKAVTIGKVQFIVGENGTLRVNHEKPKRKKKQKQKPSEEIFKGLDLKLKDYLTRDLKE